MADDGKDDNLSEMAQHRGFKLVKSRRRKPGSGDYGLFGLTDPAGKPLLGITDAGLTATAADIEDYLRGGASSSWKQSAAITPDRPATLERATPPEDAPQAPLPRAKVGREGRSPSAQSDKADKAGEPISKEARPDREEAKPRQPELKLQVRRFKPGDKHALREVLAPIVDGKDPLAHLPSVAGKSAGLLLAFLGPVVGCCAWTVFPTLQHGLVGRITLLIVDVHHRRRGIGSQLLTMAQEELSSRGCQMLEVMSDIELRNAHGFFRSLGFDQKSYRFVRAVKSDNDLTRTAG